MVDSPRNHPIHEHQPLTKSLKQAILTKIFPNQHQEFVAKAEDTYKAVQSWQLNLKELQLLEKIRDHQQADNPGYISFCRWKQLHKSLWGIRVLPIAENTWKLLRLINRGEVHLPTGLVSEVLKAITIQCSASEIKLVLENFLIRNKLKGGLAGFRDLKNYPPFQQIISQYLKKDDVSSIVAEKRKKYDKQLFTRLEKHTKEKQHKLQQLRYNSLTQEMQECTFSPAISPFRCQPSQIKYHKQKCQSRENPKQQESKIGFKAAAFDFKIYDKSINDVPGANAHIKKHLMCQSERQRLQRYISKPFGSFK